MKNIKKYINIIFSILVIVAMLIINYNYLIQKLTNTGKLEQTALNNAIMPCSNFMEALTIYGNNFFERGSMDKNVEFYSLLKYNSDLNNYTLDAVGGTDDEPIAGNITGLGSIPESDLSKLEMNLALNYNEFFSRFYNKLPDIAWLYYTSENNFINMYPWISSKDFMFTEDIKNMEFFTSANPQNNPLRKALWTHAYVDAAGKGLMVSLSSPIYNKDTFMGVVSLDLTTNKLSEILNCEYDGYLIDDTNSVIATSRDIKFDKEVPKLNDLMKISENDMEKMKELENNSIKRIGWYYVYKSGFSDAPWTILITVPVYLIIAKALLFTVPVIIIVQLLLITFNEVEQRKKIEEKIKNFATTDSLTGLKNRRFLDEIIEIKMTRSDRYQEPLSIIIFDLDHFKKVNDTWGHPIGDEMLKHVAEITNNTIRESDIFIRLGGEEFMIVLPNTNITGAVEIAERVRKALEENEHPVAGKQTASFGVAEKIKDDIFNDLYKRADKAVYLAKESGRNRVVRYEDNKK